MMIDVTFLKTGDFQMKQRKFVVFVFFFMFACSLFAQENKIEIIFPEAQEIYNYTPSENYIAISTKQDNHPYFRAFLYNKNGEELFKKTLIKGTIRFNQPVEKLGIHVLILSGHEAGFGEKEQPDQIHVYSLKNSALEWETTSIAAKYELSPDATKLLTCCSPGYGRGKLEIISLVHRKKTKIDIPFIAASWLDNNRVILIQEGKKKNPEYKKRMDEILRKEREVIHTQMKLKTKLKDQKIAQNDFEKKDKDLESKKKLIRENKKKFKRGVVKRFGPISSKAIIYHIDNKQIEKYQDIALNSSQHFKVYRSREVSSIHVNHNEIILLGILKASPSNKGNPVAFMLSQNLKPKWVTDTNGFRPLLLRTDSDELLLFSKNKTNIYSINRENGSWTNESKKFNFIKRIHQSSIVNSFEKTHSDGNKITIVIEN
jgi:hypothetical protein